MGLVKSILNLSSSLSLDYQVELISSRFCLIFPGQSFLPNIYINCVRKLIFEMAATCRRRLICFQTFDSLTEASFVKVNWLALITKSSPLLLPHLARLHVGACAAKIEFADS